MRRTSNKVSPNVACTTISRQYRLRANALTTLVARILSVFLLCSILMGAEPVAAPAVTIEEQRLPLSKITAETLQGRIPIPLDEYHRLKRLADAAREAPATTRLIKAEYTATYAERRLTDGRLTWAVQHVAGTAGSWSVQSLGLALKDLRWGDQPAVWGTSPTGYLEVLIDRPEGQITGTWELDRESNVRHDEFLLKIPPATVSSIKLRVPTGFTVSVPGQANPTSGAADTGWNLWTITLGGQRECRIVIRPPQSQLAAAPLILVRGETAYGVRQEGLRYVSEMTLDVSQSAVRELSLLADGELEIYSISYGDILLPWKTEAVEGRQRLLVTLPDALLGTSRMLSLRGVAPIKTGLAWKLPQVFVEGAAFDEGQTMLRISPPLQLQQLETTGYLQNSIESTAARDELTFKQFRPDGTIRVTLGKPQPRIMARVLSDLQTKVSDWTCLTQLQLTAAEGSAFELKCRIPAGWDVIDVRDVNSPKLEWSILTPTAGERLLALHFVEALSVDKPRTIEIDARRGAGSADQTFAVPAFEPLGIDGLQMLVAVNSAAEVRPDLEAGTSFEECTEEDLDSNWTGSKFWQSRLASLTPKPLLLRLNGIAPEGHFTLQSKQTPIEVSADVRIKFAADKVTKSILLRVSPQHGRIDRVLVYCGVIGPQLSWTMAGTPPRPVEARKLPTFRQPVWGLPTTGELWELRLPQPQSTPFELEGIRTRGLPPAGRLGMVFVPQAQAFHGQVSVEAPAELGLELKAEQTESDGIAEFAPGPLKRSWPFQEADAALSFQTRVGAAQAPDALIRRVSLNARWTLEPGGHDYYVAKLELGSGFQGGELRIGLPDQAEPTEVQIDRQPIQFQRPAQGEPLILTNVADEQIVTVAYRSPSHAANQPIWHGILLPRLDVPVLRFDLELMTPAGFQLGGEPRGMVLKSNAGSISALQRLFGPLGRPSHQAWFNPFLAEHWSKLVIPVQNGMNSGAASGNTVDASESVHTGWQVFRGSSALLPDRVEVWLWSSRQASCVAWLGFWGCLLLGASLRRARLPSRGKVGSAALMLEILLAFTLPGIPAQIAGACLAGTLLVMVWPRSMISRPVEKPAPQEPQIPQDSTQSYRVMTPKQPSTAKFTLWGLLAALSLGTFGIASACAAPILIPAPNGQPPAAFQSINRVVIPVDAVGKPIGTPPFAYVPDRLAKDWMARYSRESVKPDWLIQSGEYHLSRDAAGQVAMTARFEVAVLSDASDVEVAFPLTGINFGGPAACLVDGKVQSILTHGDTRVLYLRLAGTDPETKPVAPPMPEPAMATESAAPSGPASASPWPTAVRRYKVEFQGYPVLNSVVGGSWMEFAVPRLNSARLFVKNGQAGLPWALQVNSKPQSVPVDQPLALELGPLSQLRIETAPVTARETTVPRIEARMAALADVQPAMTRMSYQVKYSVSAGEVSGIVWLLPPRLAVRQVVGPEVSDWRVETLPDAGSRLRVDLKSPVAEGFFMRVDATLPNDGAATQGILPPVQLLSPNNEPLRPMVSLVGVRSPSEYQVEAPADAGEQIATATVEDFLKEWNESVPKPQLVFSLLDPNPVKIGLKLLAPQRVVRMQTVGVLGSRQLHWNVNATIEVQNAPAFSHELEIDPRLAISSVTIQEDAANRLLRWTRSGNLLHVFLRDKTTGTQILTLQCKMPSQIPQDLALPTVKVRDATLADAKLQLYQEADLEVELTDADKWDRLETPSEVRMGAARNLLVGRFNWPEDAGSFVVQARQNEPVLNYSAVTSIQPRDGRWKLKTSLLFQVEKGHGSQFSIRVPPELPVVDIDAGNVRQLFEKEPDGGQRITLIPQAAVRGRFSVQVGGDVNIPATGQTAIPEIVGLNATKRDHFVVLPEDAHLTVDSRTSGLVVTPVPGELATLLPTDLQVSTRREYLGSPGTWSVSIPRVQEDVPQDGVLWTETQIWCGPVKHLAGRTTTIVGPRELENLEFLIPEGTTLQGVMLDGEFISHAPLQDQTLKIPLTFPQAGHILTLYWTEESAPLEGWLERRELSWPRVLGQSVSEQYVTLTPPTGFRARSAAGQSVERFGVQLGELTVLMRLMERRAADGPPPQDAHWTFLQRRATSLFKRLQGDSRLQIRSGELAERFARLQAQFAPWERQADSGAPAQNDERQDEADSLRPFASLEGNLAGPHSLLIKFPGTPNQSQMPVSMIRESLWSWGWGLLIGTGILGLVSPLLRWRFPEWLANHPSIAWTLLGLVWWTCLSISFVGLICLAIALLQALPRIPWQKVVLLNDDASVLEHPSS